MTFGKYLALLTFVISLTGCGNPVPPEKSAYVGEWQAQTMYLLITQDGSIKYNRLKEGATTSLDGPLKGFKGDDIEFGIGALATTFVVSKPPHQVGEQWVMVVDGTELVKTSD